MTIIVAAKNRRGIVFCYDTAEYLIDPKNPSDDASLVKHAPKVHTLERGVAVGISFSNTSSAVEVENLKRMLQRARKQKKRSVIEQLQVAATRLIEYRNSENASANEYAPEYIAMGEAPPPIITVDYLIGVAKTGRHTLLVSQGVGGNGDPGLREVSCAGIGSGMYKPVQRKLARDYDGRMRLDDLISHLKDIVQIAKAEAQKRRDIPLEGMAVGLLDRSGYHVLESRF